MNISTKTIIVVGIIQCIILTLVLVLFFQYQRMLESAPADSAPATQSEILR